MTGNGSLLINTLSLNFTIYLYITFFILILYFGSVVYKYDQEMLNLKKEQMKFIEFNKKNLTFFNKLSDGDMELLKVYISHIIDKKKIEKQKFGKITGAMKTGCVTGCLAGLLSGATVPASLISGLTFGTTSALYNSISNYNNYKKYQIDRVIKHNKINLK
jgi:hypothetical protein